MEIVVVDVALKPEILDPQGRAIFGALGRVGLSEVPPKLLLLSSRYLSAT
jgi:phosphoribosylformylglycinamidine (FGAM) synthase PurS component